MRSMVLLTIGSASSASASQTRRVTFPLGMVLSIRSRMIRGVNSDSPVESRMIESIPTIYKRYGAAYRKTRLKRSQVTLGRSSGA